MARPPSQKGTSFAPVVLVLKQNPQGKKLVPQTLWKYFDEPVLISGWYPEKDYWVLIEALVRTIDAAAVGGDVWRYFAKFSAQRDIGGKDVRAASDDTTGGAGVYRNYASIEVGDVETFFRRAARLWSQYHDSGRMEIVGGQTRTNAVIMRLHDFMIPIDGFVRLQGCYIEEYGKLVGIEVTSRVTRSTSKGDPFCE